MGNVQMIREIDCIERLIEINHSFEEIRDWLVLNKFADEITINQQMRTREQAEFIYQILKKLEKEEKLILLYFEWTLLPKQTIKITCVTSSEEKLFTYGL